nr:[protein-PII] uridylyltransferase [uncultured Desulfuromonas sp.]
MITIDNSALLVFSKEDAVATFDEKRPEFLKACIEYRDVHQELVKHYHRTGGSGRQVVEKITLMTDMLLEGIFHFAIKDFDLKQPCTLIALGGYGRSEMNPLSDIDVMFFCQDSDTPYMQQFSERILYLLWDLGFDVGHCVRNEKQCIDIAGDDLTACTALLDSRYLCGDESLFAHYEKKVLPAVMSRNSRSFIREKMVEHDKRIKKYGSSVYLLEPNIKEGEGGLRDLHTALWISKIKYKVFTLRGLVIKGVMSEEEEQKFLDSLDYLWRIRTELHYLSARKNDQLHFEQQEKIALFLGYRDSKHGLAVEQFMQDYYAQATRVEHLASTMIARASDREREESKILGYLRRRNVDDGFYALRGELNVTDDDLLINQPELMMKAFWLAQRQELKLSLKIKTLIRDNLHLVNDRLRRSRVVTSLFLDILRYKRGVYETLSQMHHLLFLNQLIPEFKRIYCRVQHDAYHIYTVDTHTLFAIREVEKLWRGEYKEKKPLLTQLSDEVEKPELLILSVMLHDIGKGEGQKHSEKGAEMIPTIARRLGLNKEDSQRLQFLVLEHLQMAHISQRRDLHDEKMIAQFAQKMEMSENLKMLYILTFADIKAVGPDVWSEWKGFLLQELYEKTYDVIERGNFFKEQRSEKIRNRKRKVVAALEDEFDTRAIKECLRNFSTRYLMTYRSFQIVEHVRLILSRGDEPLAMSVVYNQESSYTEVILVTVDIAGLFSKISGVMAANGVNILGAQIFTQKSGIAVDILQVGRDGNIYDDDRKWATIKKDLIRHLQGCGDIEEQVEKRKSSILGVARQVPTIPPRIDIDNDVSDEYTVVDVTTMDRVGLLYQISNSLKKIGVYIGVSKITTKGDRAGDTFYVQDIFGHKIVLPEKIDELRETLLKDLSS